MFKFIRRLVLFVIAIFLLIAIGIAVLLYSVNNLAKTGIETAGQYALGVPTKLQSINIAIFSGQCDLTNLSIANPKGFAFDHFMKINKGQFKLDTSTLLSDPVVIEKLHFTGVELSIEKTQAGANYQVILDNLQKTADSLNSNSKTNKPADTPKEGSGASGGSGGGDSGGTTNKTSLPTGETSGASGASGGGASGGGVVIRDILIEDVVVNINVDALGLGTSVKKTIRLKEPIHLTNIGSAQDAGAQMSTVIAKLVQSILSEIIRQGGGLLPADIANELGQGLKGLKNISDLGTQILQGTVGGTVQKVSKITEDVAKSASKVAGDATQEIGKAADGLLKGMGGLLGGKKKDDAKK